MCDGDCIAGNYGDTIQVCKLVMALCSVDSGEPVTVTVPGLRTAGGAESPAESAAVYEGLRKMLDNAGIPIESMVKLSIERTVSWVMGMLTKP
jgi:hypothetical protein